MFLVEYSEVVSLCNTNRKYWLEFWEVWRDSYHVFLNFFQFSCTLIRKHSKIKVSRLTWLDLAAPTMTCLHCFTSVVTELSIIPCDLPYLPYQLFTTCHVCLIQSLLKALLSDADTSKGYSLLQNCNGAFSSMFYLKLRN